MGRRKSRPRIIKKRLPSQFLCPNCGMDTISIILRGKEGIGRIICGSCGLKNQFPIPERVKPVDAYCIFVDRYYGVEETVVDA